jgi:hypothetical protein
LEKKLTYLERELLVKTVMSSMPTHFLTCYKLPKWAEKDINHFRHSFLWRGKDPDRVKGGHCLVKWKICTQPKKLRGRGVLEIKELEKFGSFGTVGTLLIAPGKVY